MSKNPDRSVTLTEEDARRLDALITFSAGHLRSEDVYASADATEFAVAWRELRREAP